MHYTHFPQVLCHPGGCCSDETIGMGNAVISATNQTPAIKYFACLRNEKSRENTIITISCCFYFVLFWYFQFAFKLFIVFNLAKKLINIFLIWTFFKQELSSELARMYTN
jgi:hypothetical protein